MQSLNEEEGRRVYESNESLVFVWESVASLQAGGQPVLLKCKRTASNAGVNSSLAGSNSAPSPMEGFKAVIFDSNQSAAITSPPVRIWSGRDISVFDFELPTTHTQSAQVDGAIEPLYQIYLQTDAVIFPADRAPAEANYVWERETFAVAGNRNEAKFEDSPGYFAPPDVERSIIDFFQKVLQVEPQHAKVLPYSEERSTVGKRLSRHPLHDAFIGKESRSTLEKFYSKSRSGMLIPDIREHDRPEHEAPGPGPGRLPRVQKVLAMPLKELLDIWRATARRMGH